MLVPPHVCDDYSSHNLSPSTYTQGRVSKVAGGKAVAVYNTYYALLANVYVEPAHAYP